MHPVCCDTPICLDTSHMFGHPSVCFNAQYVWKHPLYVWTPVICLDACHMFGWPLYIWMMFGCPLYIQNTKKAYFVTLRGCAYVPIHLDTPCVWMPICMFACSQCLDTPSLYLDVAHMFGRPHIFGNPVCLDGPTSVDVPCMFGNPPYVWMPSVYLEDVWMLSVHIQHKKNMLCETKGCPYAPIHLDAPHMFGCPLMFGWIAPCMFRCLPYVLLHYICLDDTHMFRCSQNMFGYDPCKFGCPHMFGCPSMFGCSIHHLEFLPTCV